MLNTRHITVLPRALFLALLLAFAAQPAFAQSDWFEDEEEETASDDPDAWDVGAGSHRQVAIRLNGEDFPIREDVEFEKDDTLDIKVRYLKPGSPVILTAKKGGIKIKRKVFYANNKGQLDLEVRTGGKKVSGKATLIYTPSLGAKRELDVKLTIR